MREFGLELKKDYYATCCIVFLLRRPLPKVVQVKFPLRSDRHSNSWGNVSSRALEATQQD